jgi:hypothetical protein
MKLNLEAVRADVARATTEDLLDRATVYRDGMEPEALALIDAELRARGVGEAEVAAHTAKGPALRDADGLPLRCARCSRPAVTVVWGWHRLFGLLPLFPVRRPLCAEHAPGGDAERAPAAAGPSEGITSGPAVDRRRPG